MRRNSTHQVSLHENMVILERKVMIRARCFSEAPRLFHLFPPLLRLRATRFSFVIKRNGWFPFSNMIKVQQNTEGSIRQSMDRNDVTMVKPEPNCRIELPFRSCNLIDDRFGFDSSHTASFYQTSWWDAMPSRDVNQEALRQVREALILS